MPIYEFLCPTCNRKTEKYYYSPIVTRRPICNEGHPDKIMRRVPSPFATMGEFKTGWDAHLDEQNARAHDAICAATKSNAQGNLRKIVREEVLGNG